MIKSLLMILKNLLIIYCVVCIGLNLIWCVVYYVIIDNKG